MAEARNDLHVFLTLLILIVLGVLGFLAIKGVLLSVLAGLLLAYIFMPLYKKINKKVPNKKLSATLVLLISLAIIIIPLWIITPIIANQVFEIFRFTQSTNVQMAIEDFARGLLPTASEQFIVQLTVSFSSVISESTSLVLNYIVQLFLDIPKILINAFIVFFVFFYGLIDADKLKEFVKDISPLNKSKEKEMVKQFKDITDSLVYGQIIVGIVQGIIAGIGLWIFGVPNALVLTIVAVVAAIIPIIGPIIVWLPAALYLFGIGETGMAIGFIIYNIFLVSVIDNILRSHIVAKRTKLSPAIVLIGMLGGIFIFGIMGLILGPLILAYCLTFLELYKNRKLSSVFTKEQK